MRGSSNAYNLFSVYVFNSITWSRKLTNIYSTAGKVYSLTCDVSLNQNLRQSPVIEWVGPDGNVIDNTTLRDVSLNSSSPSTTMTCHLILYKLVIEACTGAELLSQTQQPRLGS